MFNGIEIDMLSLGDADCILVSFWSGFIVNRVLIDGGNKGDAPIIREFLRSQQITDIDHVLSTHLHDDHSGGLIELLADPTLNFGKLWFHIPHGHVESMDKVYAALQAAGTSEEAAKIRKSLETAESLFRIATTRSIPFEEPFKGMFIGRLEVCSPTREFYAGLVAEITDAGRIKAEDAERLRYDNQTALEEVISRSRSILGGALSGSSLLSNPQTSPENESSVVTAANHEGEILLFTADAGISSLTNVVNSYLVRGLRWMQIPHHGSRRNLTESLIEIFAPKTAYVSAGGADSKHPRRAVVNAFKKLGTNVYSTHYPTPLHLRHSVGNVPTRPGYNTATPLWDENKLTKIDPPPSLSKLSYLLGPSR
jgi:beta-lactamase superfamily II metal-dependent hydrolase